MKKKLLSILLCLVMCLSLVPTAIFAVDNPSPITKVTLTGAQMPVVGQSTDTSGITITTTPADAFNVEYIFWFNSEDWTQEDTTFKAERTYYLDLRLSPKEGYYFQFDSNGDYTGEATCNGQTPYDASKSNDTENLFMRYGPFTAVDSVAIHEVTVLDFESPIAGKTAGELSNLRVPEGAHYSLDPYQRTENDSLWYSYENKRFVKDSEAFVAGMHYDEGAWLMADAGYYFADDCTFTALDKSGNSKEVDKEFVGVDSTDNTEAYVWTTYELAVGTPIAAYNVWVSGKQVDSENKSDVLGDGKVSYDPATKTLTVAKGADITGTKCNALIYSEESELIINAPDGLTLNSSSAGYGVMMGISGAKVTVNGSTDITVKGTGISAASDVTLGTKDSDTHKFTTGETAVSNGGKITINGSLTAVSANDTCLSAGSSVIVTKDASITSKRSAISNGGSVTIGGNADLTSEKGNGISAPGKITLGSDDKATHKIKAYDAAIGSGSDITINGSLTAESVDGAGLSTGGNIKITKNAMISSKDSAISNGGSVTIGGNADLTSEKDCGISAPGKIILGSDDKATHKIKAYDIAITNGSDIIVNGSLTAESADGTGLSTSGNIEITKNVTVTSKDTAISDGGSVTIGGNADLASEKGCGISAPGKIILGSDDKATHKIKVYDIAITNGSDIIVNGSLTAESADSVGLSTGGNIEITKDATVTSKDTAIDNYGNVIIGGNATVKVEDGDGISAIGTVTMVSGTWDIDASGTAIKAGEGITYPTDTHTITTPEGGKIDKVMQDRGEVYAVTDANGTIAKHAIIKVQNAVTPDDPTNPDNPANPDNPTTPTDPTTPTTPADAVVPETGDSSNAMLWTMLVVFSGAALVGVTVYSKKRKHN